MAYLIMAQFDSNSHSEFLQYVNVDWTLISRFGFLLMCVRIYELGKFYFLC